MNRIALLEIFALFEDEQNIEENRTMEIYDLIIIGSGPAGLTAGIYSKRAGLNALVLEKHFMSGGQVLNTYEVDNYPGMQGSSGFDMGMKFREHADTLGVRFAEEDVVSLDVKGDIKKVVTNKNEYKTKAIIIASGASHRKLNVPGEEELSGKGVSYCATCDGAFFRDKITAVVGGGDVAVEDAVFLARVCKKVYVIHRRDELRAAKSLQDVMLALDNVEMLWDSTVEEIVGSEKVKELVVENVKTKEKKTLQVDGVFIAVGIIPNSQMYASLVETDQAGYIVAGEDGATNVPGIYVAGDVRTKLLRQIVTAVSDGANAVTAISEYLMKHPNF